MSRIVGILMFMLLGLATEGYGQFVGIGTAAPTAPLTVFSAGPTYLTDAGQLNVASGALNKRLILGYDATHDLGYIGAVEATVLWRNLALQPLGGNVGIGTAAPFTALHVANALTLTGGGTDLPPAGGGMLLLAGGFASPVAGRTIIGDGTGWRYHLTSRVGSVNTDVFTVTDRGQVGINVTAPTRRLEVSGTGGASVYSTNDGVSTTDWIALNTGGATGPRVVQGAIDGVATLGGHNQALNAWTNLNLNPAGNVGIGTAGPTTKLDIDGDLRIRALTGSGTRMVTVDPTGVIGTAALPTGDNLGNHTATQHLRMNDFWISNDGTAEGLRIDNDGRVGVNFVPPFNHQLSVNGVGGAYISSTNPGSGTSDWIALNAGGAFVPRVVAGLLNGLPTIGGHNAALTAWEQLLINPGGAQVKLGGTTHYDDTYKLSVDGTVYAHNLNGVRKYVVNGAKEGYLSYFYNTTHNWMALTLVDESYALLNNLGTIPNMTPNASIYISINKNNAAICPNSHLFNVAQPIIANHMTHYLSTDLGCPGSANVNIEITVVYK